MNNALLYFGGLLVVILAALFAVPLFIDWNGYRGTFEEGASKVLGRDVRVGGDVNVRFLPTPYVRFEKVRLADPTGHTGESFIRADSFTMWLSGPALLRGVLEANTVELNKPTLALALDGNGSGNWASLRLKPAALPFVPKDVTLNSVKLIDGTLALYNAASEPIGKIENIDAELAAEALDGPFKLKATAQWAGEYREVKLVTDKPASDGSIRIKANVRSLKALNSYTLDGKVENLSSTPKFDGELTAKLPSPADPGAAKAEAASKADQAASSGVDFRSLVTADTKGAQFNDITISFENAAEPQTLTGTAKSAWPDHPRLDVTLASKWLDLDRIAAPGEEVATFPKLKQMALNVMRSVTGEGAAGIAVAVDQVKMGGETAGALNFDVERNGSDVRIRRLNAGLPGGSRLSINGEIKDDAGKVGFAGSGSIHGSNAARLLAWAAKSGNAFDLKAEGPFSADGQLQISDTRFELKDAALELNGRPVTGEVTLSDEGRRRISVSLEGKTLDTSQFFPATAAQVETQIRELFGLAGNSGATKPEATQSDIELKLLAAELKHGDRVYNNVDARLALVGGNIDIGRADFRTPTGLKVGFEGELTRTGTAGKGTIAYEVEAATAAAAQDAANVFGLSDILSAQRLAALAPAQVAGLAHIGKRSDTAADVSIDGVVNGAQVTGQAIFDGGFSAWRAAPSSSTVTLKAQAPGVITGLIGLPLKSDDSAQRPTEVVVASSGVLASGAASLISIKSEGLDTAFNGRATWPEKGSIAFSGPVEIKARNAQELVALAGYKLPGGIAGTPVEGQVDVAGGQGEWKFASRQLVLGNSTLSGTVGLKSGSGDATTALSGELAADRVALGALLASLADKPPRPADDAAGPVTAQAAANGLWPEAVFSFAPFKTVEGALGIRFGVLDAAGELRIHDGAMTLALAPDRITVSSLTGRAAGGSVEASAKLENVSGGTALTSSLRLAKADLAALSPRASGRATLDVTANAKAQSPAGLMAALAGSGTIELEKASLPGPSSSSLSAVADKLIETKETGDAAGVAAAIESALAASSAALGSRKVAIKIADGTAKIDPVAIDAEQGMVQLVATADLSSMRVDGRWQVASSIKPLPPAVDVGPDYKSPPPKGPLPPVSIVYTGRFDDVKTIVASVDAGELQRELVVRQMERNVEELERLRKRDEEMARRETERRKALEAEKAAAAAAAAEARAKTQIQVQPPLVPDGTPVDAQGKPLPPILPQSNGGNAATPQAAAPSPPVTVVPLTVEPIDAPDAAPATAEVAPPKPVAPRPQPRPQAAPRPSQRRTSSDEVMRSLGAVP